MAASDDVTAEPIGLPRRERAADIASRVPVEMLASEYLDALRAGQTPTIDEYVGRYPHHADELRDLLPLVVAMEDWKADRQVESTPCPLPQSVNIQRLGDCRMVREIGRGGMGVVFEAIQESLGRRVAVKLLPWRSGRDERWRERFQREARLAAQLKHANIVPVFRFGESEGFCYYVMPFIVGMGLDWVIEQLHSGDGSVYAQQIEQTRLGTGVRDDEGNSRSSSEGVLGATQSDPDAESTDPGERHLTVGSWRKIAKIGAQAAAALRHAHAQGLLHRDIKPANLLLDTGGKVWMTDFGLAQPIEQVGQTPSIAGTLRYMAPEQLEGNADERSDIYALGLTLYELVTLRPAFDASSRSELMRQIRDGEFAPVKEAQPELPSALTKIITRATATDPEQRFASADALTSAILDYLNRSRRRPSRRGWLSWLLSDSTR